MGESIFTLSSQKFNPYFLYKHKLKNITQHWFSRTSLRGFPLICFWILSTPQASGVRESLDSDAERIREYPICVGFGDHVEGLLLLQISAFSSLGKAVLRAAARLEVPPILTDSSRAGFWSSTLPGFPVSSPSILYTWEHHPSEMQLWTRKCEGKCY